MFVVTCCQVFNCILSLGVEFFSNLDVFIPHIERSADIQRLNQKINGKFRKPCRPFPNFSDVGYSQIGNEAKRDKCLACDQRKVNTNTFQIKYFSNEFQIYWYLFLFFKEFQNKIILKNIVVWDKIRLLKELLNITSICCIKKLVAHLGS